jgi:signal peptidase I
MNAGQAQPSEDLATNEQDSKTRKPWLAALANLLIPPLGHVYVGKARRGVLLWVTLQAIGMLAVVSLLRIPGLPAIVLWTLALATGVIVLPVDAFLIARRSRSGYRLRPYNRAYVYLGAALLLMVTSTLGQRLARRHIQGFRIPSEAMMPTLRKGDCLYVDKLTYRQQKPRRGDIVVFPFPRDPTKDFIERVVGLPNEVIEIRNKQVLIDGTRLSETYTVHVDPTTRPRGDDNRDNFGPFKIGPREFFVLGDNRDKSNDSRYWGPLTQQAIRGKATVIYWSWESERSKPRWNRVGMRID